MDISDEDVARYRDAFKLKDKDGTRIRNDDLATVLWSLGHNPTDGQIQDLTKKFGGNSGFISFQSFLEIMSVSQVVRTSVRVVKGHAVLCPIILPLCAICKPPPLPLQYTPQDPKSKLQNASRQNIIDSFQVFDKGNSGRVNAREMLSMLSTLGDSMGEEEAARLLERAGIDQDGTIEIAVFVDLLMRE